MLTHYLKIALRNIFKDKIYSLINLIGLSVAIACCFLLIFWIKFELSFEDCQPKAGRIYKVLKVEKRADGLNKSDYIRPEIASQLKKTFPEIEAATVIDHQPLSFVYENKEGIMADYVPATPDYLDIFSYEYIEGSVLSPNTLTIFRVNNCHIFTFVSIETMRFFRHERL